MDTVVYSNIFHHKLNIYKCLAYDENFKSIRYEAPSLQSSQPSKSNSAPMYVTSTQYHSARSLTRFVAYISSEYKSTLCNHSTTFTWIYCNVTINLLKIAVVYMHSHRPVFLSALAVYMHSHRPVFLSALAVYMHSHRPVFLSALAE